MSISPSLSLIPRWPKTTAQLHPDGSITMTLNGAGEQLHAADLAAARVLVLERVARFAEETLGRPVRLHTTDPDGSWELAVHPDGHVDELASHPHPTSAQPTTRVAHRTARSGRPRHLALAALLVAFIATAGILLSTSHPASSPVPGDPATALSSPTRPGADQHAAVAGDDRAANSQTARRRAATSKLARQRVARAQAARQRAVLRRRVARRAAARRRTVARRVSRRQAAARRAAARPRTPPKAARQAPAAVAPAPPSPARAPVAPVRAVPQRRPVAPRPSPPPSPTPQCDIAFCG